MNSSRYSLLNSSNDAAVAFAEAFEKRGLDLLDSMNAKATELGFTTLHFTTVNGLDKNGVAGGVGSAREIAQLFEYAWTNHADIFSATTQKDVALAPVHESAVLARKHEQSDTVSSWTGAFKTGMTRMAGGNLGVVVEKGPLHPIVVVVLGSTEYGRFQDVEIIVEKVFEM
jgi:D-alanyl-D-alanine carboxypeptidase